MYLQCDRSGAVHLAQSVMFALQGECVLKEDSPTVSFRLRLCFIHPAFHHSFAFRFYSCCVAGDTITVTATSMLFAI
jgi:hypothetical protein